MFYLYISYPPKVTGRKTNGPSNVGGLSKRFCHLSCCIVIFKSILFHEMGKTELTWVKYLKIYDLFCIIPNGELVGSS